MRERRQLKGDSFIGSPQATWDPGTYLWGHLRSMPSSSYPSPPPLPEPPLDPSACGLLHVAKSCPAAIGRGVSHILPVLSGKESMGVLEGQRWLHLQEHASWEGGT